MAIQAKELSAQVESTVIGESILVNGKLEGDEDLTVRGRVHGSITLTKTLIVEPSGVVKADARVRNAIVSGVVVGNITASESVHLTKEGRMVGDIAAPRVIIVEGAAFRGHVDMGVVAEPKLGERTSRPQVAPVSARPQMAPPAAVRPMVRPVPPRPPLPAPPRVESRPPAPPPPPPPPAAKPAAADSPVNDVVTVGMGKKKVVVKRKK
ncbi:MAG: polymer-forming cytoskeletal protein [Deltaproteobacteria bacterium]|nr:polymer-forming cytoskeletal protein [Deltaproteobacteria bacterium]